VHDPDPTWSDRCYFFAASPDGTLLLAAGYGRPKGCPGREDRIQQVLAQAN
jgi:hypothetical protein